MGSAGGISAFKGATSVALPMEGTMLRAWDSRTRGGPRPSLLELQGLCFLEAGESLDEGSVFPASAATLWVRTLLAVASVSRWPRNFLHKPHQDGILVNIATVCK